MGFGATAVLVQVLLTDVEFGTSYTTLTLAKLIVTSIVLVANLVKSSKDNIKHKGIIIIASQL